MDGVVLVLNQNYEPLNVCNLPRAFRLVFGEKAEVIEYDHQVIRTVRTEYRAPSVIRLQQAIAGIAVDSSAPVITATNESGTALGANGGLDVAYWLHARYGVGFFARYAAGSVNLPSASSVKVGGFQGGGGLRLRF